MVDDERDTGEVVDPLIAQSMYDCEEKGETLCRQFIEERLEKCVKPISDTIPRTGLYTFSNRPPVDKVKTKNQFHGLFYVISPMNNNARHWYDHILILLS